MAQVIYDYDNDIVLMPVPRRYQHVVHRALADAMEERATKVQALSPNSIGDSKTVNQEVSWSQQDMQSLRQHSLNAASRALLDLTAERAGEWVSVREVERRAERTYPQTRAELAGLTQLVKRVFSRKNWPVETEWGAGGEEQVYYRLTPELASTWIEEGV